MKTQPLILLTGGHTTAANGTLAYALNCNYAEIVRRAGGIPLLAPDHGALAKEYAALADGLLLTGGKDVDTALYGAPQTCEFSITDTLRDDLEMALIAAFVELEKPIFGICRGFQILNVFFGGTLWQDIPSDLGSDHGQGICHDLVLEGNSVLRRLYGETLSVNSYHHQGVHTLAEVLRPTAYAMAGDTRMVEAFEHKTLPISAVQWHPERMTGEKRNPIDAKDALPLIEAFLQQ